MCYEFSLNLIKTIYYKIKKKICHSIDGHLIFVLHRKTWFDMLNYRITFTVGYYYYLTIYMIWVCLVIHMTISSQTFTCAAERTKAALSQLPRKMTHFHTISIVLRILIKNLFGKIFSYHSHPSYTYHHNVGLVLWKFLTILKLIAKLASAIIYLKMFERDCEWERKRERIEKYPIFALRCTC